jgi:hypothetical protein
MTNTTTPSVIKVTTGTLAGDVFYGSFDTTVKNKRVSVMVSNHIKDVNKEYEFRIANKCQAGFINIHWMNVYTTKGGKWYSIDKGFLEVMTVGDMRQSFPDMCDMNIWSQFGAKTWADKAFTQN